MVFVGIPGPELDTASAALLADAPARRGGPLQAQHQGRGAAQRAGDGAAAAPAGGGASRSTPRAGGWTGCRTWWGRRRRRRCSPGIRRATRCRPGTGWRRRCGCSTSTSDFAPVVDLDRGATDNALDDRYFGATPEEVIPRAPGLPARPAHRRGRRLPQALPGPRRGGGRHPLPRVGGLPAGRRAAARTSSPSRRSRALAGAVMVATPSTRPTTPRCGRRTLSPAIIGGILRGRLGFEGLAFSDDMEMKALDAWGDLPERCEIAFAAGCDVLLRLPHPGGAARRGGAALPSDALEERVCRGEPPPRHLSAAPDHPPFGARVRRLHAQHQPGESDWRRSARRWRSFRRAWGREGKKGRKGRQGLQGLQRRGRPASAVLFTSFTSLMSFTPFLPSGRAGARSDNPVAPLRLGLIEALVGAAEDLGRSLAVLRPDGDADTDGDAGRLRAARQMDRLDRHHAAARRSSRSVARPLITPGRIRANSSPP